MGGDYSINRVGQTRQQADVGIVYQLPLDASAQACRTSSLYSTPRNINYVIMQI